METTTKKCPYCQKEIDANARKCPFCQSDLRGWTSRHPLVTIILALIGIFIVTSIVGAIINGSNSTSGISAPTAATDTQAQSVCPADLVTFKTQTQTVDYKKLEKDPNSFTGQKAQFTGQILQIQESGGNTVIRLAVTKTDYGWDPNNVVWVDYQGTTDAVQDDVVTVYGVLAGSYTYTSEANYSIALPSITACVIDEGAPKKAVTTTTKAASTPLVTSRPQAPVAPQPVAQPVVQATPKTWHTAYTYTGNTSIQTPPFSLSGDETRKLPTPVR